VTKACEAADQRAPEAEPYYRGYADGRTDLAARVLEILGGGPLFAWVHRLNRAMRKTDAAPIPMLLWCPLCRTKHVDVGAFATKAHKDHACQNLACGLVWRPAKVATVGVDCLPGYKDEAPQAAVPMLDGKTTPEQAMEIRRQMTRGDLEAALRGAGWTQEQTPPHRWFRPGGGGLLGLHEIAVLHESGRLKLLKPNEGETIDEYRTRAGQRGAVALWPSTLVWRNGSWSNA